MMDNFWYCLEQEYFDTNYLKTAIVGIMFHFYKILKFERANPS